MLAADQFGKDFLWGVAMAALQNEGACEADGRGTSIWNHSQSVPVKSKEAASLILPAIFITVIRMIFY